MKQKKLLFVLLAGAMVVSGGSISGLRDYTGSSRSSIFYRMERTAGGIFR